MKISTHKLFTELEKVVFYGSTLLRKVLENRNFLRKVWSEIILKIGKM